VLEDIVTKAKPKDKKRYKDASSTIKGGADALLQ